MNEQIIDAEHRQLVVAEPQPQPPANVSLFAGEPSEVITQAVKVADALKAVVQSKGLVKKIQGREFIEVAGWQTLGAMTRVTPFCEWTRETADGWEARVVVKNSQGVEIGAAEAECTRKEKTWANRDGYAIRSMAQTRATSKALRMVLGFIVVLAGFADTPKEEMPGDDSSDWAWVAGFIDGEGCLGLYTEKDPRKGPDFVNLRPAIQIVNTHEATMQQLYRIVGCGDLKHRVRAEENHQDVYTLAIRKQDEILMVLRRVQPFLRTKTKQAVLLTEYCKLRTESESRGRYNPRTPRELEIREELLALNARGQAAIDRDTPAAEMPEYEATPPAPKPEPTRQGEPPVETMADADETARLLGVSAIRALCQKHRLAVPNTDGMDRGALVVVYKELQERAMPSVFGTARRCGALVASEMTYTSEPTLESATVALFPPEHDGIPLADNTRKALFAALRELGIEDRDQRLSWASACGLGDLASFNDLSDAQGKFLLNRAKDA